MKTKQHTSAHGWNPTIKLQNQVDFSGRNLFVGIDVHKQRWQVAVYYDGLILSNCSIEGSSAALLTHLRKRYGEAQFNCVYECGPFGFTLVVHCIAGWGIVLICCIPDTMKEEVRLTKWMRVSWPARAAGLLHAVHIPTEKLHVQASCVFEKAMG